VLLDAAHVTPPGHDRPLGVQTSPLSTRWRGGGGEVASLASHKRFGFVAASLLTLVALALRLNGLVTPTRDLWIDETFSVWLATLPPLDALRTIAAIDQHPPLYALLLHLWLLPGENPWWTRLLSVLLGAATIPVGYRIGQASGGRWQGLLAASLLGVSPLLVRYSQEARMYALVIFLVALATFFLIEAVERRRRPAWIGYGITTLLLVYTHNIALFVLPGQALFVLWSERRRRAGALGPFAATLVLIGVVWLPWLPTLLHQSAGVIQRFWTQSPPIGQVAGTELDLFDDFIPSGATIVGLNVPLTTGLTVVAAVLFAGLVALGLAAGWRRHSLLFLGSFAVPVGIDLVLSFWRPIFEERVLIYTSIGALMLVASGLACSRLGRARLPVVALVLALNLASLANYSVTFQKERWRDATALLAQQARPGDLILFNATWTQLPFDYYYRLTDGPQLAEHGLPVDLFDRGVLEPPMEESDVPRIGALTAGRARVWVLLSHDWYNDPQHLIAPATGALFRAVEQWSLGDIIVLLYRR
jgi:4-amino-4-deoxy-L-arabinose transferase-like glycosyltransferase